jgi:hypothetical protein
MIPQASRVEALAMTGPPAYDGLRAHTLEAQ